MDYLLTNIAITSLMLLTVKLLKEAPAKLHLCLLLIALVGWFIPWQLIELSAVESVRLLPAMISTDMFYENLANMNQVALSTAQAELLTTPKEVTVWKGVLSTLVYVYQQINFFSLFIGLCLIGATLFLLDIRRYQSFIRKLTLTAQNGDYLLERNQLNSVLVFGRKVQVKVIAESQPGMATGLFSPVIWVNKSFINSSQLSTILLHEITHIRQFDPLTKWLATFARRIFWWNPLVHTIAKQVELMIELNCDQSCYQIKKESYSIDLAEIILQQCRQLSSQMDNAKLSYIATIHHQNNVNIKRLDSLNKEKTMKLKYVTIACASIAFSSLVGAEINASANSSNRTKPALQVEASEPINAWALRLKERRDNGKSMSIYLPDAPENADYNEQIKQLVALSKNALSADTEVLASIYQNVEAWKNNRSELPAQQNFRVNMYVITIQHFLLQQQGKIAERVNLIMDEYKTLEQVPQFFRNHLAQAYLELHNAEKAIETMSKFDFSDHRVAVGVIANAAKAFAANAQYEEGLALINSRLALGVDANDKHLLNFKHALLLSTGNTAAANEVAALLKQKYEQDTPYNPLPVTASRTWSPILDHI